jgi:hypothetical protein
LNKKAIIKAVILACVSTLGVPGHAQASTAKVVYTVEGSPSCNTFSSNAIQSVSFSGSALGASSVGGDGYVTFKISDDGTSMDSWEVSEGNVPVNFVILTGTRVTGKQKSEVYHFGTTGSLADSNVSGPGEALQTVTFCYGLAGPVEPPPVEVVFSCEDLAEDGGIDETLIAACPPPGSEDDDPNRRIIFSVDPDAPNGGIQACTCNFLETVTTCDQSLPAGETGSCLPNPNDVGVGLRWVPWEITGFQNGTGYCYTTLSGGRICAR